MSSVNSAEALEEVRRANAAMIARAKAPLWYHPAAGALAGGLAFIDGAQTWLEGGYFVLFFAGLMGLIRVYRNHTGTWVSGYRKGRTRWVAVGAGVLSGVAMLGGVVGRLHYHLVWPSILAGVFVFVMVTAAGFLWEAAYRRDLEEAAGL